MKIIANNQKDNVVVAFEALRIEFEIIADKGLDIIISATLNDKTVYDDVFEVLNEEEMRQYDIKSAIEHLNNKYLPNILYEDTIWLVNIKKRIIKEISKFKK